MENGWRNTKCILSETAGAAAAGLTEAWLIPQSCVVCPEALTVTGQELCPRSLCGVAKDNWQTTVINENSIKTLVQGIKNLWGSPRLNYRKTKSATSR